MNIILTSFRDADNWSGLKFSIARWNPKGFEDIPIIGFLSPYWEGKPMVHLEPDDFRDKYEKILNRVSKQLDKLLVDNSNREQLVFLCWCNPDRQKGYSRLYCHRILVGYWIEEHHPDIHVIYADGADKPVWDRGGSHLAGNKK